MCLEKLMETADWSLLPLGKVDHIRCSEMLDLHPFKMGVNMREESISIFPV